MPEAKSKRSTVAVFEERINDVFNLLVNGARPRDVVRFASEKEWNVDRRQIENYIAEANKRIKAESAIVHEQEFGRAVTRLHDLYKRSVKISDYKTALAVQKEIHALLGLNAAEKIHIEHSISEQERVDRLNSLLDTARARRDGRADSDFVQ